MEAPGRVIVSGAWFWGVGFRGGVSFRAQGGGVRVFFGQGLPFRAQGKGGSG